MDNTPLVRGHQCCGALHRDPQELLDADGSLKLLAERHSFDILHHQEDFVVGFKHVVHTGDVLVGQPGGTLGFVQEPSAVILVGLKARRDPFQSNWALQRCIVSAVHLAHPALSQPGADGEAPHSCAAQISVTRAH